MQHLMRRRTALQRDDAGFTLLEIVVSLVLLGMVASAVLPFFVRGMAASAELQRRQAAVAVASSAMEEARSVVASQQVLGGLQVTGLVKGRDQAAVIAQWAASTAPDLAHTYKRWDPAATATSTRVLPLRVDDTVANQAYSSQIMIGTCYRSRTVASAPCTATAPAPPVARPTGTVELARIIIETRWTPATSNACGAGGCVYRLSSLVDPTGDPLWNTGAGEAVDDVATVRRGQSVTVDVLANDPVVTAGASPVTLSTPVVSGATVAADGKVTYAAPSSAVIGSVVEIKYTVRNAAGTTTNVAVLRVTVRAS